MVMNFISITRKLLLMAEEVKASLPCHPMSVLPEENAGLNVAGETFVSIGSRAQGFREVSKCFNSISLTPS